MAGVINGGDDGPLKLERETRMASYSNRSSVLTRGGA